MQLSSMIIDSQLRFVASCSIILIGLVPCALCSILRQVKDPTPVNWEYLLWTHSLIILSIHLPLAGSHISWSSFRDSNIETKQRQSKINTITSNSLANWCRVLKQSSRRIGGHCRLTRWGCEMECIVVRAFAKGFKHSWLFLVVPYSK